MTDKPFLILQLRPETDAADGEFAALLDKGGLSAERVHRIRLDCENLPEALDVTDYAGVIVGGGPGCVSDAPEDKSETEARIEAQIMGLMPQITARDHPFMGCCYGLGILAQHLQGTVSKARYGEPVGATQCTLTEEGTKDPLTAGLEPRFEAFVGHKEAVQALPPGCTHLVAADTCPIQMVRFGRNVYATQFHPEADAAEFEARIRIYRNHGYFPPEEADTLIAACHAADVTVPPEILRRFAARYG
ncbi:glutamine amidotransferase [Arenibacterium sp. CAU 1754]